jgi:hypothetical protein
VRLTIGGDRILFPGGTSTKNADLTTSKYLWNSVVSTYEAMYMCADVNNFYLNTLLDRPEYMRLSLNIILQEIIDKYNLLDKAKNGYVYIFIDKGIYGLPQAGGLANNLLVKGLAPHGYHPVDHTRSLASQNASYNLYPGGRQLWSEVGRKEHANHLLYALKQHYEVT